jgi:hypothetical protein
MIPTRGAEGKADCLEKGAEKSASFSFLDRNARIGVSLM